MSKKRKDTARLEEDKENVDGADVSGDTVNEEVDIPAAASVAEPARLHPSAGGLYRREDGKLIPLKGD